MVEIDKILRKLAKTNHYQTILSNKELGLKLFQNEFDYTPIQISFVNYLNFYHNIMTDIAMGDVDEIVLSDSIYEMAYSYYKKEKNKKKKAYKPPVTQPKKKKNSKREIQESVSNFKWVFKSPKKKV